MTEHATGRQGAAGSGPVGGHTSVDTAGLRELGTGLGELADTLGAALRAVDSVPVDALRPVLGPVGADFTDALLDATARHRHVLHGLTRVAGAAGDLVLASERAYSGADADTAGAITGIGRGTGDVDVPRTV